MFWQRYYSQVSTSYVDIEICPSTQFFKVPEKPKKEAQIWSLLGLEKLKDDS